MSAFSYTPLSIFVNGNIAVQYFFVLTGFLVARNVITKEVKSTELLGKICNRYVRLLPIIILAVLFTFLTMILNLQYHLEITNDVANTAYLKEYCNFNPTIFNMLYDIFIGTFFDKSIYVNPFWTIKYELFGYVYCLLACYILKHSKLRRLGYLLIAICSILTDVNYVGFFMGAFVADLVYCSNDGETILNKFYKFIYTKPALIILAIIGLYFATCPKHFSGIHFILDYIPLMRTGIIRATGCAILIFCLCNCNKVAKIFEWKGLLFIGRLSFHIYAFHWPLMLTLQAFLFKNFLNVVSYDIAAVGAFLITLPVIILVSWAVSHIEKLKIWNVSGLLDKTMLEK